MALDRNGTSFTDGDDVVLIGKCRSASYSGDRSIIVVGGQPVRVVNAEVLKASTLATYLTSVGTGDIQNDAVTWDKLQDEISGAINSRSRGWLDGETSDWSGSVAGTGVWGQQKIRYVTWAQDVLEFERLQCVRTGSSTASGNNAVGYRHQRDLWQHAGSALTLRVMSEQQSRVLRYRWGFWGQDTQPTASGTPTHGTYFEWDPTAHGNNNVHCITDNGGSPTVIDSGYTLVDRTPFTSRIDYISTTEVAFRLGSTLPVGPSAKSTSNIPVGSQQRQGTPFVQIFSNGTGNWADLFLISWRWRQDRVRFDIE